MDKENLILIGAGGHARSCIDVIESCNLYKIIGLVGTEKELGNMCISYTVIATDDQLSKVLANCRSALISVGQIKTPTLRMKLFEETVRLGFHMPSIAASSAYVSRYAVIGAGTIVMHGAIVNAGASIGRNSIINSQALIEHDANVGDHVHISTGAVLNGGVSIGSGSYIGSGSIIKEGVTIGKNCLVGMGVSVRHNLSDSEVFLGYKNEA